MEKVTIKYLGKSPISFNNFGKTDTFKPNEERKVSEFTASILLTQTLLVRKKNKGKITESTIPAFIIVEPTKPTPPIQTQKD